MYINTVLKHSEVFDHHMKSLEKVYQRKIGADPGIVVLTQPYAWEILKKGE